MAEKPPDDPAEWYRSAPVGDAHADSLLWNRDLTVRSRHGHVDFPRLREAGVRVQLFTVATRGFPWIDGMGAFCAVRGWPRDARKNPRTRAIWQVERLREAVSRSGGEAGLVLTREDLDDNLTRGRLSAVVGLEGAYPIEGSAKNLEEFWNLGVRFVGPAHLIPNAFASCSFWGYRDRGLSAVGRELLQEMARLGAALDLAHASPRALDDMLRHAPRELTLFNSHTGVKGAKPHWRNLDDRTVRAIAERGGIVALILARKYLGDPTLAGFLRHVRHAATLAGPSALAIGSDFDGFVALPRELRDVTDYPKLAPALRDAGFARAEAMGILGGNLAGFLRRALPSRNASGAR